MAAARQNKPRKVSPAASPCAASEGRVTAATATPSGWALCRMPMASPRSRGGEPAEDEPPARRVHRGAGRTGQHQARAKRHRPVYLRGGEQHHARGGEPARQDQPLAPAVRGRAPRDQGEQQPHRRAGHQDAGFFQRQATCPQCRDQVRKPVLKGRTRRSARPCRPRAPASAAPRPGPLDPGPATRPRPAGPCHVHPHCDNICLNNETNTGSAGRAR